jgi:hypothetical protein
MGKQFMICENSVFPEYISLTSDEMSTALTRENFPTDKKKKQDYDSRYFNKFSFLTFSFLILLYKSLGKPHFPMGIS